MPISSKTEKNGYRTYKGKSGHSYPSVTTVLSSVESKYWLKTWKEENPDYAQISQYSAALGTRVHTCNEDLLNTGTVDFSKYEKDEKVSDEMLTEMKARHEVYKPFLSITKPLAIEEALIWEQLDSSGLPFGYGGTVDLIGSIADPSVLCFSDDLESSPFEPNKPIVFVADYKNNRSQKSSQDFLKAYCQLSAYAAAKNVQLSDGNYVRHGFVLSSTCSKVKKQAKLHIYYVDFSQLNFYFGWYFKFLQRFYKRIEKEEASWSDLKQQAIGYFPTGELKENGKPVWGYLDENYLGRKLEIVVN